MFQTLPSCELSSVSSLKVSTANARCNSGKQRRSVFLLFASSSSSSSSSERKDDDGEKISLSASPNEQHQQQKQIRSSSRRLMLSLPLIVSSTTLENTLCVSPGWSFKKNSVAHAGEENTDSSGQIIQNPKDLGDGFKRFYGEATSSSSYGGYGGSDNNFDKFKYYFEIPSNYEKDTVNKTEKSTNGTDARWVNPKDKKAEKAYCITLPGYTKLKEDRMGTFEDLALSDYTLQDAIYVVDGEPTITDRYIGKIEPDEEGKGGRPGQLYADYDLVGAESFGHIFATITVYGGRLYSLFVWVPPGGSVENGKRMRDSYRTIENVNQEQMKADMEFYRRS